MPKAAIAIATILAAALAAAPAGLSARPHVQHASITFLPGDRVLEGNVAFAPGVPVRMTVLNYTRELHTFTVPGLHVNVAIFPARGNGPRKTTVTFTAGARRIYAWHCLVCPSGIHGARHAMSGNLYAIISPSALP